MAWMIIKSAGDDYSFVATLVDGDKGHTREYAEKQAREVTAAMKAYKKSNQRYFDGIDWNTLEAVEDAIGLED